MGLAVAPSTLIHSFLAVGTILHPSCIWTHGLHMAGHAGVSGSVRLTPQTWMNQGKAETLQRTNIQTPQRSPKPCMCSCHSTCRNECQRGCSQKRRNEQTSHSHAAGPRNRKNRNKVADGREIYIYIYIYMRYICWGALLEIAADAATGRMKLARNRTCFLAQTKVSWFSLLAA